MDWIELIAPMVKAGFSPGEALLLVVLVVSHVRLDRRVSSLEREVYRPRLVTRE